MSSFVSLSDTSTSSSIYLTTLLKTDSVLTPAGSEVTVKDVGVSPRLYFNLVKSKLKTVEKDKLETQLRQLQSLMPTADDLGQTALYEHLSQALAIAVRELEVAAVGCDRYVEKDTIEKFRKVRWEQGKPIVYFEKWEKFPRVPPSEVAEKLKYLRSMSLFDEYWVLYLNYAHGKPLKTHQEKVKEKDPILFGKFAYQPDRFYVIADWVDEYCDLTLEQFVDEVKKTDLGYEPGHVEIGKKELDQILKDVMRRHKELNRTFSLTVGPMEDKRPWWRKLLGR
jgi:hypothetical protein